MNTLTWVLQILLAVVFASAGLLKLVRPRAELANTLGSWVDDFPAPLLKPLGLAELLTAAGLVLPLWMGVLPMVTPVAAIGVVVIMVGAAIVHTRRSEYANLAVNLVIVALAVLVAWLRIAAY
jgi:uncharacterized membrane protein YphA (DoxX/SURF4 family)